MKYSEKSRSKVIRTAAILVVCCALAIYLFFENKDRVISRPQTFCQQTESDADYIYLAVSEYISRPENQGVLPAQSEMEVLFDVESPWTLTACGENFFINVIDRSGRCPAEYQSHFKGWNSNIYTLEF